MGLVYNTSQWADGLWKSHLDISRSASQIVEAGEQKQDEFSSFAQDIHSALYIGEDQTKPNSPDWATKIIEETKSCAEWKKLAAICSRNPFAAGIATESVLHQILGSIPQQQQSKDENKGNAKGGCDASHGVLPSKQGNQPGKQGKGQESGSSPVGEEIRKALRLAARKARQETIEAQSAMEGLEGCVGGLEAGSKGASASLKEVGTYQEAFKAIKNRPALKRITELAGRLKRLADSKAKSVVKPAMGELYGVEQGDDLSRLLPEELAQLRHRNKFVRLMALEQLAEKRSLQYSTRGRETLSKGPAILLVDESGSMDGERDNWAKAVTIAFLSIAVGKQKRTAYVIGYNAWVTHKEKYVGKLVAEDIINLVRYRCDGGTSFNPPVQEAIKIIEQDTTMKDADVLIITDGAGPLNYTKQMKILTATKGVKWIIVGVHTSVSRLQRVFGSVTQEIYQVTNLENGEVIAPILNMEK